MTTRTRRLRWAASPVLAAVLIVTTVLSTTSASAAEHPRLPARTAAQLLAAMQDQAGTHAFSGTVKTSAHLGLPSLPESVAGGSSLSPQILLTGNHTFRVWFDGPDRQRLAMPRGLAETDIVHNGKDFWTYDSTAMQVTHATLSSHAESATPTNEAMAPTPAAAADEALKAIDPTTAVSVDRTARVAGRPAYQLVLQPRDARSLIRKVSIAMDSKTMLPLRVQIVGQSNKSAYEVAFSSITFGTPRASIFHFRPPHGAKVVPATASTLLGTPNETSSAKTTKVAPGSLPPTSEPAKATPPRVLGSGWTAVVVLSRGTLDPSAMNTLGRLMPHGAGARLLTTALVSVFFADDGSVYIGAVRGSDLQTVAATGHGL
jgi:outer membrane lipoprotein-sorting protein